MWKKIVLAVVLVLAAAYFGGRALYSWMLPTATAAQLDPEHARIADTFLDHLDAGRYDEAHAMLAPDAQAALAGGKLGEVWSTLPKQLGERKSRSALRGEAIDGDPVATATLQFGMLALDARIGLDAQKRIDGFRIVPAAAGMPAAPAPAPVANDRFVETEFAVGTGETALPGTLTHPANVAKPPVVVLVHGSGPHDRDETIGPNRVFRDLAHGLADRGIASLRYEKRTKARPQDFAAGNFTVDGETVDDAVAAARQLQRRDDVDGRRVFVVGHSLGAMMAPRIAQREPGIAGLVLLAATARPLQDVVVEQVDYLANVDGTVSDEERSGIDEMRTKAAAIETLAPDATDTMLGLPAAYWIDLRDYDAVASAQALPQPMLVLQGSRDYQVTPAGDFARWQQAFDGSPRVTLRAFDGLNHLFIAGSGAPNPQEYFTEGHVDARVIDAIAAWIDAQPTAD